VTIETEENIVFHTSRTGAGATGMQPVMRAWCTRCQREVEMIGPEQAAAVAGVTARTIYRCVESGRVHFVETAKELILVCRRSLSNLSPGLDL
jgi:hypothetical protein